MFHRCIWRNAINPTDSIACNVDGFLHGLIRETAASRHYITTHHSYFMTTLNNRLVSNLNKPRYYIVGQWPCMTFQLNKMDNSKFAQYRTLVCFLASHAQCIKHTKNQLQQNRAVKVTSKKKEKKCSILCTISNFFVHSNCSILSHLSLMVFKLCCARIIWSSKGKNSKSNASAYDSHMNKSENTKYYKHLVVWLRLKMKPEEKWTRVYCISLDVIELFTNDPFEIKIVES